jgi:hypothetical protein
MEVSVSFRRRGNLLSKAISIPIAATDKFIIYSFLRSFMLRLLSMTPGNTEPATFASSALLGELCVLKF